MNLKLTGIVDYSGQAHCMEHASTVSSYRDEVYEGDPLTCWCGRDLSIENLTPWDASSEEDRADTPAIKPFCPNVFKGCNHTMAMGDDGGVGCVEFIDSQTPEGGWKATYIDADEFGPARWIWFGTAFPQAVPAIAVKAEEPKIRKGDIVRAPGGVGVVTDIMTSYGEALVRYYAVPEGGTVLDVQHGAWETLTSLTILGFDGDEPVYFANRMVKASTIR